MIAIQYLEPGPQIAQISPAQASQRLQRAFDRLPVDILILGWNLPAELVAACAETAANHHASLFYWHPLLSGDGVLQPRPEWRAIGAWGEMTPGFRGLPEFTFICPNRRGARAAILERIETVLQDERFDGIFLDRMRYPSPANHPGRWLACFCPDCQALAAAAGLSLAELQTQLSRLLQTPQGAGKLLNALLHPSPDPDPQTGLLQAFLGFRAQTIAGLVDAVCQMARNHGKRVGFDCFAPSLMRMVGQEPEGNSEVGERRAQQIGGSQADWSKAMLYAHTLGPAGMPFELLELLDWLVQEYELAEETALALLSASSGLSLPEARSRLVSPGLDSNTLANEIGRGHQLGIKPLWAGIELVNLPGVTHLNPAQLRQDLQAIRHAGAEGLVLSWDLWQMPDEYLEIVGNTWRP